MHTLWLWATVCYDNSCHWDTFFEYFFRRHHIFKEPKEDSSIKGRNNGSIYKLLASAAHSRDVMYKFLEDQPSMQELHEDHRIEFYNLANVKEDKTTRMYQCSVVMFCRVHV